MHECHAHESLPVTGREASTGRKIAIKKIKVGQFKDGLDMSAVREVKYLRELKHQNVIEVRSSRARALQGLAFLNAIYLSSWMSSLRRQISISSSNSWTLT